MGIYISDTSFRLVAIIDSYESFIWTERYSDYGDFELYLPMEDLSVLQYLKADYYVEIRESDRTMIIEDIQIDTDVDDGPLLKISGRSLESILDRRIIWKQTSFSNKTVIEVIWQLLRENVISPADANRRIEAFEIVGTGVGDIDSLGISQIQFTGDNLYDTIKSLCDVFGLGFKITATKPEERGSGSVHFYFELFSGVNRSYENDDRIPHVIFSPNFDNLLNSSYFESHRNLKTVALVAGQGEGTDRIMVEAPWRGEYSLLLEQPEDWSTHYNNYYTKSDEKYERVIGVEIAPTFKYGTYYIRYEKNDIEESYGYLMLQGEPDDWSTNYASYFKGRNGVYTKVSGVTTFPTWSRDTYYKRVGNNGDIDGTGTGLSRRELFVDARDLAKETQQQDGDGNISTTTLSDGEYDQVLVERGNEKLAECSSVESFEGGIDPDGGYRYGCRGDVEKGNADYSIGDIVQVENEYGMSCRCRVTEFIRSKDSSGSSAYPTFAIV